MHSINVSTARIAARSAKSLAAAVLLTGALFAALPAAADSSMRTESRNTGNFTKVSTSGAVELEIAVGGEPSVTVSADGDLIGDVKTQVSNDELRISMEGIHYMRNNVTVKVTIPKLRAITASGASRINVTNLNSDVFALSGSGSTRATLSGKVDKLAIDTSGASRVDANGLVAKTAAIDTSGAGHVEVNASDKLVVSISGAGKVVYMGRPAITQHISGAGKIVSAS